MGTIGSHVSQFGIESLGSGLPGFQGVNDVYWNNSASKLIELSIKRGEGHLSKNGQLVVATGVHTGRSAKDKHIVDDPQVTDEIWWDGNRPMKREHFDVLLQDMLDYAQGMDLFVQDLFGGADPVHRLPTRVICEYAWHALFIQHLLLPAKSHELKEFKPGFTIIDLANFKADPERHGCRTETVIACDFTRNIILIGGTEYAGEIKKSVFTILNYLLPHKSVMPMHCSVNVGKGGDAAVFFGLSGTGKTTLSADPERELIGDDEHGWSETGLFNFEGGCYAKMINLSPEGEPQIYAATSRFGTVLENVVMDSETGELDFDDASLAENSRGAYPIEFIANASVSGLSGHPKNIIMLTADAFGVMPPIAKLTPDQAMYHFLSGYTAKVAGTEKDLGDEPVATFSTCFGAAFLPLHPTVYGNLLRDLIAKHDVNCWLVNTGWTGGAFGVGQRMPLKATRALLNAALNGELASVELRTDTNFGFKVPISVPGIDPNLLNPRATWPNRDAYDTQARKLVEMFIKNFQSLEAHVDPEVRAAAPSVA